MLPLQNRRILITRPAHQSSGLATLLEARGATAVQIPTIEITPPTSYDSLDRALHEVHTYDWLIFTSANAVKAYASRALELRLTPRANRIAVIGPATAHEVSHHNLQGDLMPAPSQSTAEGLADYLLPDAPGARMLLVRAAEARDVLPQTLLAAGAHLTIAEAYRTVIPAAASSQLAEAFGQGIDAITFTSASTALNLAALLASANQSIPPATVLASIGPITSQAMRELALKPTLESPQSTTAALAEALERYFERLPAEKPQAG